MIRIDGFPMDLALTEEHSFPGEVTTHPVESGPDISDHIRTLPEEITLEAIVSDTPIGEVAAQRAEGSLPSEDALAKLREIRAARRPVTIETSLGVFESMGLVSLDVPKDAQRSGGLFFTAQFRKVNLITNRRTRVARQVPTRGAAGKKWSGDGYILWRKRLPPYSGAVIQEIQIGYIYNRFTAITEAAEGRNGRKLLTSEQARSRIEADPEEAGKLASYYYPGGQALTRLERDWFFKDWKREMIESKVRNVDDLRLARKPNKAKTGGLSVTPWDPPATEDDVADGDTAFGRRR